ncbi:uncharacterized protein NECHADRAFT_86363 [Fusarium vanettenii 77-13-4]|uniref:chitin synthase n=1 Tax=Fusarium vanettenii (strain ATCC MYA-4622 / CBS 123669 / FGSC 9596 / NRRL 45880 / 77-13-4) TaxID=660122 RepID=C7ZF22_FUSV7|nr:uncharacterized protein NECHADRAFT_86363 [Fusarium vanettenii 77-13-4]EEU37490.1 hypothetical protein NECHADRAFT_86363 [Fusarium vanettenii 77-13-4]
MDPLSIATGCAGLITAIGGLSINLHSFVRTCREARGDLDSVSRELLSLQTILELIKEDASDSSKPFPKTLNQHITAILGNCNLVVSEIQTCITKYGQDRLKTRVAWAINGQGDISKLRSSLEAHKTALEIALDMLALHLTKEIKADTTEIRNDTAAIKEDTTQILEEIARLQARLPPDAAAAASNDFILQRFFEEMTTYTEQALDANSSKRLSFDEGPEEGVAPLLQQDSWPYHSMSSSSKQSSRGESWASSQIQNPYWDSEATSNTSFPTIVNESHGEIEDALDRPEDTYGQNADENASTERQEISGFEIPVSDKLLNKHPSSFRHEREFTRCRHSTITCSPEKFAKLDFTFRHVGFEPPRQIEIILFFPISSSEDTDSFYRRWNFMIASCHFSIWPPRASGVPPWKQILVHINCDTSLDRIDPLIRKYLHQKGILNTLKADRKAIAGGTIQAEIVEYTMYPDFTPIQVILTAYCNGSHFHMPGVDMIYSQTGWYHSLCALLGAGMVITMPGDPSEIPERRSEHTQFLSEAWANKRDISGLRTYNGITVTPLREYLSMPMRKRPKPKGIFAKIRTSFS